MTQKIEHNKNVLENEQKKLKYILEDGNTVSWSIIPPEKCYEDRYRCSVCKQDKHNKNRFDIRFSWKHTYNDKDYNYKRLFGYICSSECLSNIDSVKEDLDREKEFLSDVAFGENEQKKNVKMEITPARNKGYICRGCRKRKPFTENYISIGYNVRYQRDPNYHSNYPVFFGRVCSESCFNLFVFKMDSSM